MLVLGDAHASDEDNRRALLAAYREADADVALHVGDLEHYDLPIPTWFVAGNNEDFDAIEGLRHDAALGRRNANLLASDAVEIGGLRVAGLSGNYAPTRYDGDRAELSGDRRRHFVREDVERAKRLADVDVLLAHEAPRALLGGLGVEPIDELLDALDPALCLTGHHHRHADEEHGDARLVSLAPVWESYYLLDPDSLALERRPTPTRDG